MNHVSRMITGDAPVNYWPILSLVLRNSSSSWTVLDTIDNDPDEMLSTWEALVLDVVDRHAPLKSVRVKSMKKPSWLSDEILTMIKERDRLKKELEKG